jgi:transcriptional regulator with XRE-family HTH domain
MKPTAEHMIGVLRTTIRTLGFTHREVETRLGVSRGYLSRLFSGVMELRFDHVEEIAAILRVDPVELLRLAFPPSQKPATPTVLHLREALGVSQSPPSPAALSAEESALEKELERIVARTFHKLFKGVDFEREQ